MPPVAPTERNLGDLVLAEEYREHARELRCLANEERPAWANDALIKAADDYDRMADSLEQIYAGPERAHAL